MLSFIGRLRRDDSGATAIEYGLIAGLIAVGLITALNLFSANFAAMTDRLIDAMTTS